jgi:hypothetical protein
MVVMDLVTSPTDQCNIVGACPDQAASTKPKNRVDQIEH